VSEANPDAAVADVARIRVLPPDLADQIAAGEVVERPASIVKELVDNAIDAGARRIEIELGGGGIERVVVLDDGRGIEAEDLGLALVRHATSKLASSADLAAPRWLGFRGEALASIAAVAKVVIESRTKAATVGTRLSSLPGLPPTFEPCSHRGGTRIEITGLFANVPARRKFLRSVATELTHCSDVIAKIALVHPAVAFRARHEGRVVLDVAAAPAGERVAELLARHTSALVEYRTVLEGVEVALWIGDGDPERADVSVAVRQRVVRERAIAQIVREGWWGSSAPCAAVFVEPPRGTVDVNVHPQKAEVRFSDPQRVYAAVRRAMAQAAQVVAAREPVAPAVDEATRAVVPHAASPVAAMSTERRAPSSATPCDDDVPGELFDASAAADAARDASAASGGALAAPTYALRTRALAGDYAATREQLRRAAAAFVPHDAATPREPAAAPAGDAWVLLDCLPGPIALVRWDDDLVAIDLVKLRGFILRRRIAAELGAASGRLAAQALLVPAVVATTPADVALVEASAAELESMGIVADRFGDAAVVVRAIPATLRQCVDELDAAALLARVLPYLRLRARSGASTDVASVLEDCAPPKVAARFARSFLREALASGVAVDALPGVRRWRPGSLVAPG
jgi:DNA mismatch repair protein MutL